MIKMLHVAVSLTGEGIANYIYNYFSHIDSEMFKIDLVINNSNVDNIYQESLEKKGINVYKIHSYEDSIKQWLDEIDEMMTRIKYDIVESHVGIRSNMVCKLAKKHNIPVRIIHTHIAYEPESFIKKAIRKSVNTLYASYVTDYFGCSEDALKWTFGRLTNTIRSNVIKNAIETEKFTYNVETRKKYRRILNLKDEFVIGCVGRLCFQKNQEFLIDIFNVVQKHIEHSKLLLVGDGPDRTMLERKCSELGITNKVVFMGLRDDVCALLNSLDAFVLPSRYEGFGIVYLEAQINRLPSFGTLERVPSNVAVSNTMHYISEKNSPEEWASEIISIAAKGRESSNIEIDEFDIQKQISVLEEKYLQLCINNGLMV